MARKRAGEKVSEWLRSHFSNSSARAVVGYVAWIVCSIATTLVCWALSVTYSWSSLPARARAIQLFL